MNALRTAAAVTAVAAALAASPGAAHAAGPQTTTTLRAGIYQTAALVKVGKVLPSYVKVARTGTYATTRTGRQICTLRGIGWSGETTGNLILAVAKNGTVKITAAAVVVEVTGPCTWKRR